jgi:hypothetical protein
MDRAAGTRRPRVLVDRLLHEHPDATPCDGVDHARFRARRGLGAGAPADEEVAMTRPGPRAWIVRTPTGVLVLALLAVGFTRAELETRRDVARMTDAAVAFLAELGSDQRARAAFAFDSDERMRWHFIPTEMFERSGVTLKEMSATQRERAHALLRAGLSQRGYFTATQVMELEDVLLALEGGRRFARDRDEYRFGVFGRPGPDSTWGWRFEGHHISLHFTIVDGSVAVGSPAFVGANPAEVRDGPQQGRRVLGEREDAARALVASLDEAQRRAAIVSTDAPNDILTGASVDIEPLSPAGIPASALTPDQREMLMTLVEVYSTMMADDLAERRMRLLREAGTDRITFAWAGGTERGDRHYYRVQGPTFLIEYDNTQNDANHIHSVWRDFDGDWGRDLLREHIQRLPH